MKFTKLLENLFGSVLLIVPLLYLFVDWFYVAGTGYQNFSHFLDIALYPIVGLIYVVVIRGPQYTKFVLWSNRISFVVLLAIAIIFLQRIGDNDSYILHEREVTNITENNTKFFVQISDTLDYYIVKNDTTDYDYVTDSCEVYQFVREDMFNDTIFGNLYLGNGKEFIYLVSMQ